MDEVSVRMETLEPVIARLLVALGKDVSDKYPIEEDSTAAAPSCFVAALAWLILAESAERMDSTVTEVALTCARLRAMSVQLDRDR